MIPYYQRKTMVSVGKMLAMLLAFISSTGAGLTIVLALAWMTPGASEARKQAVETVMTWGFLSCSLIFTGLAIWQIWKGKTLIGLALTLGAWLICFIVIMSSDSLVNLLDKSK
jgi:apolipoprotein N-acyltransferase